MPSVEQFLSVVTHADMAGHHSLLVDYVGSGCSDNSERFNYSIGNHARTIAAVLDNEGVKSCTIIGHSMGGTVGIMLAILRPDLVANLIVAEANISPGGGDATRRITSYSETEYVNEAHQRFLEEVRMGEREGSAIAAFINAAWSKADPSGLYNSSVALVELDPIFKEQFLELSIPRTFIYGEESLPKDRNELPRRKRTGYPKAESFISPQSGGVLNPIRNKAQPDAPDPEELERFGVQIAIVPNAGHAMMFDNLNGFVNEVEQAIQI
jgi:pimeloyl-ACP methyl ester carboxylesterase